jgi:thiamine biosynthesis lipoprotein
MHFLDRLGGSMSGSTRRRLLRISAAATACLGLGGSQLDALRHRWTGAALGAHASLTVYHPDPDQARLLIDYALAEVDRLDRIFSLQRSDSAISRFNRDGRLARPPIDLVAVLETAAQVSELSDGLFDPTVQPLWRLLAGTGTSPSMHALDAAAALVDWREVHASRSEVTLRRVGMAITLNGIAQGYITDRVADLLRDAGLEHALVALGEQRALGGQPDGHPWNLASPFGPIALATGAVAISGPAPVGAPGERTMPHLIDPRTGRPAGAPGPVAVWAQRAMLADAWSTALAIADEATRNDIIARLPSVRATALPSPRPLA